MTHSLIQTSIITSMVRGVVFWMFMAVLTIITCMAVASQITHTTETALFLGEVDQCWVASLNGYLLKMCNSGWSLWNRVEIQY